MVRALLFYFVLSMPYSSSFSTAKKASVGICTVPSARIFFLPFENASRFKGSLK